MVRRARPLLALAVLSLASCRPYPAEEGKAAATPSSREARDEAELGPKLPPVKIQEVAVGEGREAKSGDRVSVHYTGTLLDGTKFDSSVDRGTPFEFVIGSHAVIPGWDIGVTGMKKGGKRKLEVPPHLAYGHQGSPPKIGPDATLLFDIELLDIL